MNQGSPLLYTEASAHCDWDWLLTFEAYFTTGIGWAYTSSVHDIIQTALDYIQNQGYVFAFCEVAYLRRWVQQYGTFPTTNFSVSAGGFTSAENLLTHGEAFIRNYLLGRVYSIRALQITPSNQMWIPDDFGHDAQLPIVLRALGFTGVAFQRVAGNFMQTPTPAPTNISPWTILNDAGLDFSWTAADGSSVQGHWLKAGYGAGDSNQGGAVDIQTMIDSAAGSPTPLLFCPMDSDFATPPDNIIQEINAWNGGSPAIPAVLSTFDEYMQAVARSGVTLARVQSNPTDGSTPFVPHPYWTGAYATRPAIKLLHYSATRALLFAESMELLVEYLAFHDPNRWYDRAAADRAAIAAAWDALMPSTHHDYMPGTSAQTVYLEEQIGTSQWSLPVVNNAALAARKDVIDDVAAAMPLAAGAVATVAVLNACGSARDNEIASVAGAPGGVQSATMDSLNFDPVQTASDGSLLFFAGAPALGYSTVSLSANAPTRTWNLRLDRQDDGSYIMGNDALAAWITVDGIIDVRDLANPDVNLIDGVANQLVWYLDDGSLYEFGIECFHTPQANFQPAVPQPARSYAAISVLDDGPLVKRIAVTVDVVDPNASPLTIPFTLEYELRAGDNLLRMRTTGAAPSGDIGHSAPQGYSVMSVFPFLRPVATLTFGTPQHWDTRAPRAYYENWPPPGSPMIPITFEPSHQFVVANDGSGDPIMALYHGSTPAWGILPGSGALINCLLRNVPQGAGRAATGSDPDAHTLTYALRVPSGLQPAWASGPLREALAFNNPLATAIVPATTTAQLPPAMSMAATTDPRALITAAKTGAYNDDQLVLRVYQPTNQPFEVSILFEAAFLQMFQNVAAINALETGEDPAVSAFFQGGDVVVNTPFALSTISLTRAPGCIE